MSPNTHWSRSRFRSTGTDIWSLSHIPSDEKQHRSLISVILQKLTHDLIQLLDDFHVFLCFLFLCGIFDSMTSCGVTHLSASAGCDLIIVKFLKKETFAKTGDFATRFEHLSPNKRGKLPHTVCKKHNMAPSLLFNYILLSKNMSKASRSEKRSQCKSALSLQSF